MKTTMYQLGLKKPTDSRYSFATLSRERWTHWLGENNAQRVLDKSEPVTLANGTRVYLHSTFETVKSDLT